MATAQEDLAYALYVLEYSSGRFYKARDHAERAIRIIEVTILMLYFYTRLVFHSECNKNIVICALSLIIIITTFVNINFNYRGFINGKMKILKP